jgi:hypothetical protein
MRRDQDREVQEGRAWQDYVKMGGEIVWNNKNVTNLTSCLMCSSACNLDT